MEDADECPKTTSDLSNKTNERHRRPVSYRKAINNKDAVKSENKSQDNAGFITDNNDQPCLAHKDNDQPFFTLDANDQPCHDNNQHIDNDTPYAIAICPGNNLGWEKTENPANDCAYTGNKTEQSAEDLTRTTSYSSTSSLKNLLSCTSSSSLRSLVSGTGEYVSRSRVICVIICLQIFIVVLSTCLIIVLFILLFNVKNDLYNEKSERLQSNKFCVPCNDLTLGPLKEDNENLKLLTREKQDGIDICCAKGSNQTSILMNLLFQKREEQKRAQDLINSETRCKCNSSGSNSGSHGNDGMSAAHLLAGKQQPVNGAPPYTVYNWDGDAPVAHARGLQVKDSQIIVNMSGLYLVYSQIFFSVLYKGQSVNTTQALYHYVYRWNIIYPNDGNELLLKSVRTQCWAENRVYGDYTSYTAGVFMLNAGDKLYVQVSTLDIMSKDPQASFFGVVQL